MRAASPQQQRTLDALRDAPGTAADIADELGESVKTASMRLSRMLFRGQVTVIGIYQPPDGGRPARIFGATTE